MRQQLLSPPSSRAKKGRFFCTSFPAYSLSVSQTTSVLFAHLCIEKQRELSWEGLIFKCRRGLFEQSRGKNRCDFFERPRYASERRVRNITYNSFSAIDINRPHFEMPTLLMNSSNLWNQDGILLCTFFWRKTNHYFSSEKPHFGFGIDGWAQLPSLLHPF